MRYGQTLHSNERFDDTDDFSITGESIVCDTVAVRPTQTRVWYEHFSKIHYTLFYLSPSAWLSDMLGILLKVLLDEAPSARLQTGNHSLHSPNNVERTQFRRVSLVSSMEGERAKESLSAKRQIIERPFH